MSLISSSSAPVPAVSAERLGTTTIFTDTKPPTQLSFLHKNQEVKTFLDSETGETFDFEFCPKRKEWVKVFDRDEAELERWLLLKSAQRFLSRPEFFEDRDKMTHLRYSDLTAQVKFCVLSLNRDKEGIVSKVLPRDFGGEATVRGLAVKSKRYFEEDGVTKADYHFINRAPRFRVVTCARSVVSGRDAELWKRTDPVTQDKSVSWHNIAVCGSVWTCPLCSRKINTLRRKEISEAYSVIRKIDGAAYMLTFTIKHGAGDELADLLTRYKGAMQVFQKSYAFKSVTRKNALKRKRVGSLPFLGYLGRIAAMEVTYGASGWHPHEHHLWFFSKVLTNSEIMKIRDLLFMAWADACESVGLSRPLKTVKVKGSVKFLGLDIRRALSAEDYLTKFGEFDASGNPKARRWGPENEIAGSHVKKATGKGRTPFQLLYDGAQGDVFSRERFVDYAQAFLGRHQIQFSRSLKQLLRDHGAYADLDDQALAEMLDGEADFYHRFSSLDFSLIVEHDLQGMVLVIAKNQGIEAVKDFLLKFLSVDRKLLKGK